MPIFISIRKKQDQNHYGLNIPFQRNEKYHKQFYNHCMKSNHPNVMICPNVGVLNNKKIGSWIKYLDYENITRKLR